jgi:Fe-Mn family superoxide dismutase
MSVLRNLSIIGRTVVRSRQAFHITPAISRSVFSLPQLPWAKDALAPHTSSETIDFHYGKHHQTFITNLNNFVAADKSLAEKSLEELVKSTSGGVFNNAAQVWNHTFFWNSLAPAGSSKGPSPELTAAISKAWGSLDNFKAEFNKAAACQFGSEWAWLVTNKSGDLKITTWLSLLHARLYECGHSF